MKIKLLAALFICFCITNNVKGQTILNPSFEFVNTPPCAYNLDNATLNVLILNVTAFGTYENCDIMDTSCGYGMPQHGVWFIGLSVPPGGILYDAIAMELSSPLQAGQTYSFSFYQKKDAGFDSNQLDIGYSMNATSLGFPVASFPAVPVTSWSMYSVIFTPVLNASYITIRVAPNVYGWNHLDNLQLTNVTAVEEEKANATALKTYPNPATDKINISFTAIAAENENITVKIFSLTGEVVFEEENKTTGNNFNKTIEVKDFLNGIYFLSVQTEKDLLTRKIVIQH